LADILADMRRARGFIMGGMLLGAVLALIFLAAAVPFYRAQMIVGPAAPISNNEAAGEIAKMRAAQLDSNIMNFTRFENTLAGSSVAGALLKDEKIFEGLTQDRSFGLLRAETTWTPEKLAEYIRRRVRIDPVGETPLRRLVYYHPSAGFAAYFLTRLHEVSDGLIRRSIRSAAAGRVEYLQKTSQSIPNPEHRRSLTELLMEQERLLMLASVDQPYAAMIVEPASSSSRPKWPGRIAAFLIFSLAGGFAGFAVHGIRRAA
jgi:hypothetical protein